MVLEPVGVLGGVGMHDGDGQRGVAAPVLLELGHERAQRLLAAAAHALEGERSVEVEGELGLDVELAAQLGRRRRDASAGSQRIEVVEREVALDVVARLVRPPVQLARGGAVAGEAHGLDRQQLCARGRAEVVDHVELEVGIVCRDHVACLLGGVDARREAACEAEVDRGRALLGGALEHLVVEAGRDRRGGHMGAFAQLGVVVLVRDGLPDIVGVLDAVHDVREADDLHTQALGDLGREVRAGVDDDMDVAVRLERAHRLDDFSWDVVMVRSGHAFEVVGVLRFAAALLLRNLSHFPPRSWA